MVCRFFFSAVRIVQAGDLKFIDLLYKRYANPLQLLDIMIQTHRLSEFVDTFIEKYNEEEKEKVMWEIWLHRVHDKTYSEFVEIVDGSNQAMPTAEEIVTIVDDTVSILDGFQPE